MGQVLRRPAGGLLFAVLAMIALTCSSELAYAQLVDTTSIPSPKQQRQRLGWAMAQSANLRAAADSSVVLAQTMVQLAQALLNRARAEQAAAYAAFTHDSIAWDTQHRGIVRDSLRPLAPTPPPDTTTLPPPDTTIVLPPPDTILPPGPGGPSLAGVYVLQGDDQQVAVGSNAAVQPRVIIRDSLGAGVAGVEVTFAPAGTGNRFAGCTGSDGGFVNVPPGSLHRIAVTGGDGEAGCTIWQMLEDGPQTATIDAVGFGLVQIHANLPADLGNYLDLYITMTGAQGSTFTMSVGDQREFCAIGIYERGQGPPPDPVAWSTSDGSVLQFGATGPTGAHCVLVTALRETEDPLGLGLAPRQLIAWLDRRRAR